jgi:hypothetical protein
MRDCGIIDGVNIKRSSGFTASRFGSSDGILNLDTREIWKVVRLGFEEVGFWFSSPMKKTATRGDCCVEDVEEKDLRVKVSRRLESSKVCIVCNIRVGVTTRSGRQPIGMCLDALKVSGAMHRGAFLKCQGTKAPKH